MRDIKRKTRETPYLENFQVSSTASIFFSQAAGQAEEFLCLSALSSVGTVKKFPFSLLVTGEVSILAFIFPLF